MTVFGARTALHLRGNDGRRTIEVSLFVERLQTRYSCPMNSPALRFHQVAKRYGKAQVLHQINLELRPGELFGLVGVNGAGKTSLMKCLLDFVPLDGGTIDIGARPHTQAAARANLAFLPERFTPPYFMNGEEFLRYVLKLQGVPYDFYAVQAMLEALDLAPQALTQTVRQYSKGMTQKLGLAACLLAHKDLLVLDEPTSGLDPKARALFKSQLQLQRARGATAFFTSQSLADVAELCDRMAILHRGRLAFTGSPAQCVAMFGAADLEHAFLSCVI